MDKRQGMIGNTYLYQGEKVVVTHLDTDESLVIVTEFDTFDSFFPAKVSELEEISVTLSKETMVRVAERFAGEYPKHMGAKADTRNIEKEGRFSIVLNNGARIPHKVVDKNTVVPITKRKFERWNA